MKKLILVRFAPTMQPNPAVTRALAPHMKQTPKPVAFPLPGVIVTLFVTDSTLDQVRDSINETRSCFVLADTEISHIMLPPEIMKTPMVKKFFNNSEPASQTIWSLDELLDMVAANGLDSLTPAQREALNAM